MSRRQRDSEGHLALPLAERHIANPSHLGGAPELKGDSPSPARDQALTFPGSLRLDASGNTYWEWAAGWLCQGWAPEALSG